MKINNFIDRLHHNGLFMALVKTTVYCLKNELKDCTSVLDLGCGPSSKIQYCSNIKYSVGVEAFKPYLLQSQKKKIHTKYLHKKIENVDFPDRSFDAVIMIEVLEHLPQKLGCKILKKAEKWAKKKVIVSCPNGYFFMSKVDNNPLQEHVSGHTINDFRKRGYKCYGLSGKKIFYKPSYEIENSSEKANDINSDKHKYFQNMRFKPEKLFYILNAFLQIFNFYFPFGSFGLIAIKKIEKG